MQGVTLTDLQEAEKTIGRSRSIRTREQENEEKEKEEKEKQDKEKQEEKKESETSREDEYKQKSRTYDEVNSIPMIQLGKMVGKLPVIFKIQGDLYTNKQYTKYSKGF